MRLETQFFPDESRAGRLVNVNAACSTECSYSVVSHANPTGEPVRVKQQLEDHGWECISVESSASERPDSDANSEHVTTDSSSDESEQSVSPPAPARVFYPPTPPEGCHFLQHVKSKTLHIIQDQNRKILECGRQVTSAYTRDFQTRWDSSVCSNCLKHVAALAK